MRRKFGRSEEPLRKKCGRRRSAEEVRKKCGRSAEEVRKKCGRSAEEVRKKCGTLRKKCGGSAERCGGSAEPLRKRRRRRKTSGHARGTFSGYWPTTARARHASAKCTVETRGRGRERGPRPPRAHPEPPHYDPHCPPARRVRRTATDARDAPPRVSLRTRRYTDARWRRGLTPTRGAQGKTETDEIRFCTPHASREPARLRRREPPDRPTHTAPAPAPRGRRPSRCALDDGLAPRGAASEEKPRDERRDDETRTGGRPRTRRHNDRPARDRDSHLDVRKLSAHAERRTNAALRRSAWASAPSRPGGVVCGDRKRVGALFT